MKAFDVCVRGSGCVGRSLALALARQGLSVALQEPPQRDSDQPDIRAYALNAASVNLLRSLKVWDAIAPLAKTAVFGMQVHGDHPSETSTALLEFSAHQQGIDELAWIVESDTLEAELANACRFAAHLECVQEPVQAQLLALCEGKQSSSRQQLGVSFECNAYGQSAIAARLSAERGHHNVARQWFGQPDVLALLPLSNPKPEHSLALVWSLPTEKAAGMMAASPEEFEAALQSACSGALGVLKLESERAAWPLMLARAKSVVGQGWALLGDAAHVVHPLAGQGLNLGFADVATLARVIAQRETWRSLDDARLLRRYQRERLLPNWAMGQMTDGLLRLFAQDSGSVRELRNRGLTLVNQMAPLKRWLIHRAIDV